MGGESGAEERQSNYWKHGDSSYYVPCTIVNTFNFILPKTPRRRYWCDPRVSHVSRGPERVSNLLKATQPVNSRGGTEECSWVPDMPGTSAEGSSTCAF